jgi:hypothetical protein
MSIRSARLCRTPKCGRLTFRGFCLECERRRRKDQRGPAEICKHCKMKIYEPLQAHLDQCESYLTWSGPTRNTERTS